MKDGHSRRSRWLSTVLGAVLVVGLLGLVAYVVLPVPATPPDTEFYVLNASGTAANYATDLTVGESATVVVGVTNREHERTAYRLVVEHGERTLDTRSATLVAGETWRRAVTLSFDTPGQKRVDLLLYRTGRPEPYRELFLRITVQE